MPKPRQIEYLNVEVASVRGDIKETVVRAHRAARGLADLGTRSADSVMQLRAVDGPDALAAEATALKSTAMHALALAAELLTCAGHLDQLVAVHRAG